MLINRLLGSAGVRILLLYALFYLVTVIGFLWVIFNVLGNEIESTVKAGIEHEVRIITDGLNDAADGQLELHVQSSIEHADPLISLYILQDKSGKTILTNYPEETELSPGWMDLLEIDLDEDSPDYIDDEEFGELFFELFELIYENPRDEGYVGLVSSINGQLLFVGRTLDRIDETKDLFVRITILTLPLSLALALLGGMFFGRLTMRRIDAINNQTRRIQKSGDLSLRVENEKPDDEYGELIANINAMLANIERGVNNIREVSGDIAHDLRTPLSRLQYGLEAGLNDEQASVEELKSRIEKGIEETDALLETFSAIVRISQIETGLRKLKFKSFDLAKLAAHVAEAYEPICEEKGHSLITTCDPAPCLIDGDRDMITQLISNLIENALQHGGENLNIEVGVKKNMGIFLSISDNGHGIDQNEIDHIFKKFYRVDKSRTGTGNGLGLAMVKAIADLHSAKITVKGTDPGVSFTFAFN